MSADNPTTTEQRPSDQLLALQEALEASESSFRTFVENSFDVIFILDSLGTFRFVSPSWERHFGYPAATVMGKPFSPYVHQDDVQPCFDYLVQVMTTGQPATSPPYRVMCADGSWKLFIANGTRFIGARGEVLFHGIGRDITEQTRTTEMLKASEEKFSLAFNHAPALMTISSLEDDRYLDVNDRFCSVSGFSRQEVLGRTAVELGWMSAADQGYVTGLVCREGRVHEWEFITADRNGRQVICSYSGELITVEGRQCLLSIAQDITERKSNLEALDYTNKCFSQTLNSSQHILYRLNVKKGGYDYLSPVLEQITGYRTAEFSATSLEKLPEYFHPDDRVRIFSMIDEALRMRSADTVNFDMEYRFRKADGNYCWLHDVNTACFNDQGELECFFGSARDITERKQAEQALQESEMKFRTLFRTFQDVIYLTSAEDGRIIECNDKLSGYSRDELIGRTTQETGLWADMRERQQAMELLAQRGSVSDFEAVFRKKDGTFFTGSVSANAVSMGGKTYLLSVVRDMTERNKVEKELRESEERYRLLVEHSAAWIWAADASLKHTFSNGYVETGLGYPLERFLELAVVDLIHPDDLPAAMAVFARAKEDRQPWRSLMLRWKHRDGFWRYLESSGYPVYDANGMFMGLHGVDVDVTDRVLLQQEREKAQRLSSLGVLAGGIAHDFNNILTGILGNISFARMLVGSGHRALECLQESEKAALRATELTRQLLTFARGGEPVRAPVNTAALIEESLSFTLRGSSIGSEVRYDPDLWWVNADAGQINQALNNLIINAVQAMPGGGIVRVTACNCHVREGELFLEPGRYVKIEVKDTGVGIPADDIPRIFDPYFSTKEHGAGLGLSSVYSIMQRHGGGTDVVSTVGAGSAFSLYLPATDRAGDRKEELSLPSSIHRGHGRVLIMDDEEIIRDVGMMILSEEGYVVETCCNGQDAVARHRESLQRGERYRAIILDLTVPGGMGGKEAADLIRTVDPEATLIVSSGYCEDPIVANYRDYGFSGVVVKPYTSESLCNELSRVTATANGTGTP